MFHEPPPRSSPSQLPHNYSSASSSPSCIDQLWPSLAIPSQTHQKGAAAPNGLKKARNYPPSPVVPRTGNSNLKKGQRIHMYTERARRSNMNYMLSTLHSLIPDVGSKLHKLTTIDKTIAYIQCLQNELHILSKKKQQLQLTLLAEGNSSLDAASLPHQASSGTGAFTQDPKISVNIFGSHVTINFNWVNGKRLNMSSIFSAVESHKLSIEHAYTRVNKDITVYMIHAEASGDVLISKESLVITFQDLMLECSSADGD